MLFEMTIIVHGHVQGVGYRASVLKFVDQNYLQVRGYVKNLPNKTVKIVAQGIKDELEQLRKFSSIGSAFCSVDHIEEVSQAISDYSYDSFEISY